MRSNHHNDDLTGCPQANLLAFINTNRTSTSTSTQTPNVTEVAVTTEMVTLALLLFGGVALQAFLLPPSLLGAVPERVFGFQLASSRNSIKRSKSF